MKFLICVFAAAAGLCSFGLEISFLPSSDFPDTEASTNFPFAVAAVPSHRLVFSLEFQSSASNNVEVAIGRDADCDGHLSLDETALAVGFDCGDWFVRGPVAACRSGMEPCQNDATRIWRVERDRLRENAADGLWNHAAVTPND